MTSRVCWYVPQQILYVELKGNLSLEDFNQINQAIISKLDNDVAGHRVAVLVDITQPSHAPRAFEQVRTSQTFLQRHDIRFILVAGNNKLMRLIATLIFNLGKPSLKFFDDVDQALEFAQS